MSAIDPVDEGSRAGDAVSHVERRIRGGLSAAVVSLAVIGAVSYWALTHLNRALQWVAHSHEVIGDANALLFDLSDAEIQSRAIAVTGAQAAPAASPPPDEAAGLELRALRNLVADNPQQSRRLDDLTPMIEARLGDIARRAASHGPPGAVADEATAGHEAELRDTIRSSIDAFLATERLLLAAREIAATSRESAARTIILVGSGISSAVLLLVLIGVRRDLMARGKSERLLRDAMGDLESRVADRTEQLERSAAELEQEVIVRRDAQQKLQSQVQRLSLLQQITSATGEHQDLRRIFSIVATTLQEQLPLDFACVALHDDSGTHLRVAAVGAGREAMSRSISLNEGALVDIGRNGLWRCLSGQLVYEPNVADSPFLLGKLMRDNGIQSLILAPLQVESEVFGVLLCMRRARESFLSSECEFLRQLSEHVALAAYQAKLYQNLLRAYEDLRKTQTALMDQERLRALGQLASGIAHDVNNAVSPVTMYIESLLEEEAHLSMAGRQHLEIIQTAIRDVSQTVSRLRDFSRDREPDPEMNPVDLNVLAQECVELTRAKWSDIAQQRGVAIAVRTELTDGVPTILAIGGELRDAVINIVLNALDALPNGGTVMIRTKTTTQAVVLEIADNGVGMDEETRRRCLEPFFTTKGVAGSGLGLAMVYGAAQRHRAELEIDSAAGSGTTVRLRFPLPTVLADGSAAAASPIVPPLNILVIDDDRLIAGAVRLRLESAGHRVTPAIGGQAGIDAYLKARAAGDPFHVVLTDLGMPDVDGHKVAAAVKSSTPDTPVIMLTGWGHRLQTEGLPPHVDCVLSKPPTLQGIHAALARLIVPSSS